MQLVQQCALVLLAIASVAHAQMQPPQSNADVNAITANNVATAAADVALANTIAQIRASQGNAVVQPFTEQQRARGFVNDVNNVDEQDRSALLTVSDFQNAGFSADDAEKIVAGLSLRSGASGEAVQSAGASVSASVATTSNNNVINNANDNAGSPVAASVSIGAPVPQSVPAATNTVPVSTLAAQAVVAAPATPLETQAPVTSTIAPVATQAPVTQVSEAPVVASAAPLTPAPTATAATTTTKAATALSANLKASDSNSSSDGIGAATLLAGGVGCVLAVAAVVTVVRRKILHPKTPGTPVETKATYFHCEVRLTPPMRVV